MNIFERLANQKPEPFQTILSPTTEESSPSNIFEKLAKKNEENKLQEFGLGETVVDIGKQIVKKGTGALFGTYGDIADITPYNPSKETVEKIRQPKSKIEFDILQKMEQGITPTYGELLLLTDSELPEYGRIPSSQDIESILGIGEGKTSLGRIAGEGARGAGQVLAFGGGKVPLLAGALGAGGAQTLREGGIPEPIPTITEILSSFAPSAISKKLVPLTSKTADIVEKGRKIGLSEKQIAPLIQSQTKLSTLGKIAKKSEKTQKQFASIRDSLGDSYQTIKSSPTAKQQIGLKNQNDLINTLYNIESDLQKTLKPSPSKEGALTYIKESIKKLENNLVDSETLINTFQDINQTVNWNAIQGGKKALAKIKEPLVKAIENVSPELAKDFEITNELYSKFAKARKALKPDAIDKVLSKGEIIAIAPGAIALAQGNPWIIKGIAAESAFRILANELLTNPYFQTISGKLVRNFNSASVKGLKDITQQSYDYLNRKYPQEDWSFLVNPGEE